MAKRAGDGFTNATDLADYLTKKGVPFRDAHRISGELVARCLQEGCALDELPLETLRGVCPLPSCIAKRNIPGPPNPDRVRDSIDALRAALSVYETEEKA